MTIRLDDAQWHRILSEKGREDTSSGSSSGSGSLDSFVGTSGQGTFAGADASGVRLAATESLQSLRGRSSYNFRPLGGMEDTVFLLALEGDTPNPEWKWWEKALDSVVQTMQPLPAMTHVELFVPTLADAEESHFATYMGKNSGWGSSFGDGTKFYLDPNANGPSWRAIPIMAPEAARRTRSACNQNTGTPYGAAYRLFDYPFSVPPLRSFAWSLGSTHPSPAHCASLVARCIHEGLPELALPNPAAWYGPSTLYLELARRARMASYQARQDEMTTLRSITEDEEAVRAIEALLRGSDESVQAMTDESVRLGIEFATRKAITAATADDATVERMAQRQLARALLRSSQIQRPARLARSYAHFLQ